MERNGHMLDRISMKQNILLQVTNGKFRTVFPFELNLEFLAKFKPGIGSRFGPTQDLKSELVDFSVNMRDC